MVIYSPILVAVTSECCWQRVICKTWTGTLWTLANNADPDEMPITRRLIKVCTVSLNYSKLRIKWKLSQPTLKDNWSPVLTMLWLESVHQNSAVYKSIYSKCQIRRLFSTKNTDIFLISPQTHMLWYSLEGPRGSSSEYPQHICYPLQEHFYSDILKILQAKKDNFQIKNHTFFIFLLKT